MEESDPRATADFVQNIIPTKEEARLAGADENIVELISDGLLGKRPRREPTPLKLRDPSEVSRLSEDARRARRVKNQARRRRATTRLTAARNGKQTWRARAKVKGKQQRNGE